VSRTRCARILCAALGLLVGLGLTGAVPPPAVAVGHVVQAAAPPGPPASGIVPWVPAVRTAAGAYPPEAAPEGSRYHLHTSGPTVLLHLTAVHALVQPPARRPSPVLWRAPADLRPAGPVAWEVEGWPVRADGTPDPARPGPRRFTLQMDPEGALRYGPDAPADPGDYLRYTALLTWPVAGADPGVCTRSDEVRAAILAALSAAEGRRPPCAQVTWAQLATIRTLGQVDADLMRDDCTRSWACASRIYDPVRVAHAHDLVGLTGLEAAALQFAGTRWRPYLLLQAPRLQRLWLDVPYLEQMTAGLTGPLPLPALTHLTLYAPELRVLEPGWLPVLPHLTHLTLQAPELQALESDWLPALPHLTHMVVRGSLLRDLSSGWLPALPALTHLILHINLDRGRIKEKFDLPPDWLPVLPALTTWNCMRNICRACRRTGCRRCPP